MRCDVIERDSNRDGEGWRKRRKRRKKKGYSSEKESMVRGEAGLQNLLSWR